MNGTRWVKSNTITDVPKDAVIAGHDIDGTVLYVGRSHHDGFPLPAKVLLEIKKATVGLNGVEHVKESYEVLVGTNFRWLTGSKGSVPPNAVCGGRTSDEVLYIGRAFWKGSLTVGKIQPSRRCLLIPFGCTEVDFQNYEVLTFYTPNKDTIERPPCYHSVWMTAHNSCIPDKALKIDDNPPCYVGRVFHKHELLPAMIISDEGCAYFCWEQSVVQKSSFEVLIGDDFSWLPAKNGYIPPYAVEGGRTKRNEPLYIGRTNHDGCFKIGKVQQSYGCLFIGDVGQQVAVKQYEVLVHGK